MFLFVCFGCGRAVYLCGVKVWWYCLSLLTLGVYLVCDGGVCVCYTFKNRKICSSLPEETLLSLELQNDEDSAMCVLTLRFVLFLLRFVLLLF